MTITLPQIAATPEISDDIWRGVAALVNDFMLTRPDDRIVIVYTPDAREAARWVLAYLKTIAVEAQAIRMSMYDDAGLHARLSAILPSIISLASARVSVLTLERTSMANSGIFREILAPYAGPSLLVTRVINASEALFRYSLRVSPKQLSQANAGMLNAMMPAATARITTSSGTDLEVEIDSDRYRWVSNRGMWREGGFTILPPGEVSTFPANINGVLVADGAFNVTGYTDLDARLANHPVRAEIENGRLASYECDDPSIQRLFKRCSGYENFDRVGELGFGTNFGTPTFVPMNSHINERHPGLHIGFGQHAQRMDAAGYECAVHLDLITSDSATTPDGGQPISSLDLAALRGEHPPLQLQLHDEDIDALDGDCCGMTWASPLGPGVSCPVN